MLMIWFEPHLCLILSNKPFSADEKLMHDIRIWKYSLSISYHAAFNSTGHFRGWEIFVTDAFIT